MKRVITLALALGMLKTAAVAQTIPLYENFGSVTDTPVIDALAFANYGLFSVTASLPYDFQNTRYFTNRGTMTAYPGFRFADASSSSPPFKPATSFLNEVGADINAADVAGLSGGRLSFNSPGSLIGGPLGQLLSPSYLLVSADTIVNKGNMIAGAAGLLQLIGTDVDVSRSGLGIGRLEATSTHFVTESNYFPDPGLYDTYWAITNQNDMRVASLLAVTAKATNVTSPRHAITNNASSPFPNFTTLKLAITNSNGFVSIKTNVGGADPDTGRITNIYKQAAFVAVSDTNFALNVKWAASDIFGNPYATPIVEISMKDTNTVTGDLEFATLYLMDKLASGTNYTVLENLSAPGKFTPATFELTRTPPTEWFTAAAGKGTLTNTFFFDPKDTNFVGVVTNFYAAYGAQIDSLASLPPNAPDLAINDFPGRVEIDAQNLDVTKTRMRGTGLVSIKTPHLLSIQGAVVDSENVIVDLGVPDGAVTLQGVLKERVVRLNGPLMAWSAIFTNFFGVNVTNKVDDGSGTGTLTNAVTNIVTEIDYHMLIVDATGLQATKPVITHDFITHANDVVLSDPVTLVRNLLLDANTFTLNSRLTLSGTIENFASTNAPRLQSFTSKGTFTVPNIANFGQDRLVGYQSFANRGVVDAAGVLVHTKSFENSGTITSRVDGITIDMQTGQFQNANTLSAGGLNISATDVRFTASTNTSLGTLVLNASNSLADTGEGANNIFETHAGFLMPVKPALGDLLGTTINTIGPRFARVEHTWAGEDRGATAAGFQNNTAIGHLVIGGDREVLMSFRGATGANGIRGTTGANGMYVDLLELTGSLTNAISLGDLTSALTIDPSLTIYFANSNYPATQLEQLSGGRLRHVDFAGTASVVDVPVRSGAVVQMSRVVRESTTLDSDGDGIPNAYDAFPLDSDSPLRVSGARANNNAGIAISWQAQPQTSYRVEYAASLLAPSWQLLSTFTNSSSTAQTATVQDQLGGDYAQRYYRVSSGQ